MKRIKIMPFVLVASFLLCVQAYKMYIQVTYNPSSRTVVILAGDDVIIPKEESGQPKVFNSSSSLLNWLSKKGWHLEPIDVLKQDKNDLVFILSRENTQDDEAVILLNE